MTKSWNAKIAKKCDSNMNQFFGEFIPARLQNNYDFVSTITGGEGVGKSTLANLACFLVDPNFKLDKNVLYSPDAFELSGMVLEFPKYSALNADEAISILYKYEFNSKMQVALNKLYATCRKRNLASFFCMPDFMDLNKFFRRRTHAWIHVLERGKAVVMLKDKNFVSSDRWALKRIDKLFMKHFGRKRASYGDLKQKSVLRILRSGPTYFTEFDFPQMPPKLYKQYEHLSLEAGKNFEIKNESHSRNQDHYVQLCNAVAALSDDHNQTWIANKLGVSQNTINNMLRKVGERPLDRRHNQ